MQSCICDHSTVYGPLDKPRSRGTAVLFKTGIKAPNTRLKWSDVETATTLLSLSLSWVQYCNTKIVNIYSFYRIIRIAQLIVPKKINFILNVGSTIMQGAVV